ncbi:MAG: nuclear transport factor 2 family protein [Bacteroidales bacterium]|nr:nuclear transport factor 2 family protein [Bacteroidales bacterium]
MKKYLLSLIVLVLFAGTSCQEKIDIEKEKAAIIAVIEEETEAFFDSDINRLGATHVQDETNIRLTATKSGYTYDVGWEKVKSFFLDYFENEAEPGDFKEVKTNYKIKVYGESAWAVFDNDYYNGEGELLSTSIHAEFLEKVNGEWKLVFYTSIYTSTWEDEGENETEEIEEGEVESETEDTE